MEEIQDKIETLIDDVERDEIEDYNLQEDRSLEWEDLD